MQAVPSHSHPADRHPRGFVQSLQLVGVESLSLSPEPSSGRHIPSAHVHPCCCLHANGLLAWQVPSVSLPFEVVPGHSPATHAVPSQMHPSMPKQSRKFAAAEHSPAVPVVLGPSSDAVVEPNDVPSPVVGPVDEPALAPEVELAEDVPESVLPA